MRLTWRGAGRTLACRSTAGCGVDMQKVKARKDGDFGGVADRAGEFIEEAGELHGVTRGMRASSRRTKSVWVRRGSLLNRVFINVGARAVVPAMPGVKQIRLSDNSSMMGVDFLPKHLIMVGGSYIGLEFGQMFRRFGSEVTIIEMGPRLDCARGRGYFGGGARNYAERRHRGAAQCEVHSVFRSEWEEIVARVDCKEGRPRSAGTHVLLAVGRRPNTDDLGLDNAGVTTDERGYISADDQLRTNVPGIWAVGDCNGKGGFTHTSWNDAEIVAANLLDNDPRRVSDRIRLTGCISIRRWGARHDRGAGAQERAEGADRKRPMTRVGRAVEKGETQGFMKIVVDAETKKFWARRFWAPAGMKRFIRFST